MKKLFRENRAAFLFIIQFVALYLLLNTAYGFYIEYYYPQSDPITILITHQVALLLSFFHESIQALPISSFPYVALQLNLETIVHVFEGCNGLNVMIVYLSFLIAFKGPIKSSIGFALGGLVIIYLMNLLRVILLFEIALYFPNQLYLFHKYLFTGIIYLVVFVIWYFWIKHVRSREA